MNNKFIILAAILILALAIGFYTYNAAENNQNKDTMLSYNKDTILITNAFAFATAENAKTAAAFMTIENMSAENDQLIGAKSSVAEIVEIHQNMTDEETGTMLMRKVPALDIQSGQEVLLKPQGYHVMFINLAKPFELKDSFPLTLVFAKAGEKTIDVTVTLPGQILQETVE